MSKFRCRKEEANLAIGLDDAILDGERHLVLTPRQAQAVFVLIAQQVESCVCV
jgi:hypothetical protein